MQPSSGDATPEETEVVSLSGRTDARERERQASSSPVSTVTPSHSFMRKPPGSDGAVAVMRSTLELARVRGAHKQRHAHQSAFVTRANDVFSLRIRAIFEEFDEDKSGTIDRSELKVVLSSMGYDLNDEQLGQLLAQVDVDGSGTLDFEEFATLIQLWKEAAQYKIFDADDSVGVRHIEVSRRKKVDAFLTDEPWRWLWDTLFMLVTTYFFLTVVMMHSFSPHERSELWWRGLMAPDLLGTVFLFADIVLRFRVVERASDGALTRRDMAAMYLRGRFFFDLLAMLPLRMFTHDDSSALILNHARLLLLTRLPLLFGRSGYVSVTSQLVLFQYGFMPYLQILALFVSLILLLSVVQQAFVRSHVSSLPRGEQLAYNNQTGLTREGEAQFVPCMYFIVYVVTGVGYGDMRPETDSHRAFVCICFVLSMVVNGFFVGSMVSILQEADVEISRRSALVMTQAVLRFFDVPEALQEEVLQFQNHLLQRDVSQSYRALVDTLPREMQHNIMMQSRVPLLRELTYFSRTHISTIVQVADCLVQFNSIPESYIAIAGEPCTDLVIINYGFVDVLSRVGHFLVTLMRGACFGEAGVLLRDNPMCYTESFKSLTYSDLFLLRASSMEKLVHKFPKFGVDMASVAATLDLERFAKYDVSGGSAACATAPCVAVTVGLGVALAGGGGTSAAVGGVPTPSNGSRHSIISSVSHLGRLKRESTVVVEDLSAQGADQEGTSSAPESISRPRIPSIPGGPTTEDGSSGSSSTGRRRRSSLQALLDRNDVPVFSPRGFVASGGMSNSGRSLPGLATSASSTQLRSTSDAPPPLRRIGSRASELVTAESTSFITSEAADTTENGDESDSDAIVAELEALIAAESLELDSLCEQLIALTASAGGK